MTDTLTEICNHKRSLVASAKANRSLANLEAAAAAADRAAALKIDPRIAERARRYGLEA